MDIPKLKIHVLDGRRVHKEKDTTDITTDKMATVTSNLQRQTQSKPLQSSSTNDTDKDLLERITLLMRDKNRLDVRTCAKILLLPACIILIHIHVQWNPL